MAKHLVALLAATAGLVHGYPSIPHNCSYINADATSPAVSRFNKVCLGGASGAISYEHTMHTHKHVLTFMSACSHCLLAPTNAVLPAVDRSAKAYGHYVCKPMPQPLGQLLVFLPGTGTNDYTSFPHLASELG